VSTSVGILGFAHGHVNSYCSQWKQRPELDVQVVAGWDHDRERLRKVASNLGLDAYETADELLGRADVTAVVIAAETAFHAGLVEKAAAAGRTIILQKPMALTLPEADRIVAAVGRSGVPFTMAWQMRADPQNLKMKELVESGAIGRVYMVRRRHGLNMCLNDAFADSWHVDPEMNRDIWADDAAHAIDLVNWMFGTPASVTAEMVSLRHPRMPNDNGIAIFRYPDGPLVEVCCSFTNPATENTTEIIGEKGSIIQNYGDGPSCNVPRPENARALKWFLREDNEWTYSDLPTPESHGMRIASLAEAFSEFLHGKREPIASAEEGRLSLRMTLATYVASREGRRVSINDEAIAMV